MPDRGVQSIVGTMLAIAGLTIVAGLVVVNVLSSAPGDPLTVRLEPVEGDGSLAIVDDNVTEADETNNQDTRRVEVTAPPTSPGPSPVLGPGFAYVDKDNDALFDTRHDVPLSDPEVTDGAYTVDAPAWGLVVPPSVGPIETPDCDGDDDDGGGVPLEIPAGTSIDVSGSTFHLAGGEDDEDDDGAGPCRPEYTYGTTLDETGTTYSCSGDD